MVAIGSFARKITKIYVAASGRKVKTGIRAYGNVVVTSRYSVEAVKPYTNVFNQRVWGRLT